MKSASVLQTAKVNLRRVPGVITALFCISVIIMNLLANKTIYQSGIIAADGGILISWLTFLCMDIVTKALGQRITAPSTRFLPAHGSSCSAAVLPLSLPLLSILS